MADPVIVDDNDSRIKYSGGIWFKSGDPNELDSSTHGTRAAGAKAAFAFTGTSIAVYGTISNGGVDPHSPISTYSIDGSSAGTFTGTQESSVRYKQQYFQSSKLTDGPHTLVITSTVGQAFFWIDYIQYTPSAGQPSAQINSTTPVTSAPSPQPSSNPVSTGALTLLTTMVVVSGPNNSTTIEQVIMTTSADKNTQIAGSGSTMLPSGFSQSSGSAQSSGPSQSSSPTNVVVSSGSSKIPIGPIVGAVLGALLVILFIFFLLWRCRNKPVRRQGSQDPTFGTSFLNRSHLVTPFTAGERGAHAGFGSGYTVHGGAKEKAGLHDAMPSQSSGPGISHNLYGEEMAEVSHTSSHPNTPVPSQNLQVLQPDLLHHDVNAYVPAAYHYHYGRHAVDSPPAYQSGLPTTMNRAVRRQHSL